jgi:DNA-binding NtrC family response regulator
VKFPIYVGSTADSDFDDVSLTLPIISLQQWVDGTRMGGNVMNAFSEILVASCDLEMRRSIVATLRRLGADPICASTVGQSKEVLQKQNVGLIFCDRQFADGSYRDLVTSAASGPGEGGTRVVLTTNFISPGEYHEAKRSGVFDVIASPDHSVAIEWMVILAQRDELKRRDHASLRRSANISGFPATAVAAAKI